MIRLLIYMNITGSLFCLLNLALLPFQKKHMPPKYRVLMHRLNLMFFIFPLPACLFYLRRYFEPAASDIPIFPIIYQGSHTLFHLEQNISFVTTSPKLYQILLLLVWLAVLARKYSRFRARSRKLRELNRRISLLQSEEDAELRIDVDALVQDAVRELKLKRKPRVFLLEGIPSPHVSGVLHQTLCLPTHWDVPERVYYMAIKHELAHVRHKDLIFQRISLIARIVSWFSPLLHTMCSQMSECDELAADAAACGNASRDDCIAYQIALLAFIEKDEDPNAPVKGFKISKREKSSILERLSTMQNKNLSKHKTAKRAAAAVMSAAMLSISMVPALAYTVPATLIAESFASNPIDIVEFNLTPPESVSKHDLVINLYESLNNADYSKSDWYYTDESGSLSEYDPGAAEPDVGSCSHLYSAGQISQHSKNGDGSCRVDYYSGRQCSKCGHIEETGHTASTKCIRCPH